MNVTVVGSVTCTVDRSALHGCNKPFDQLVPLVKKCGANELLKLPRLGMRSSGN